MKSILTHTANILAFLIMVFCSFMMTGCGSGQSPAWDKKVKSWQGRQMACEEDREELEGDLPAYDEVRSLIDQAASAGYPFEYAHDEEGDYWKSSGEFEADGNKGDCEDIAAHFYHIIRAEKIVPDQFLYLRITERGDVDHMALVIETDQVNIVIDNGLVRHEMPQDFPVIAEYNIFYNF